MQNNEEKSPLVKGAAGMREQGEKSFPVRRVLRIIFAVLVIAFAFWLFRANIKEFYIGKKAENGLLAGKTVLFFAIYLGIALAPFIRNPLKGRKSRLLNLGAAIVWPLLCLAVIEIFAPYQTKLRPDMLRLVFYNYLIYALIMGFFYLFGLRIRFAIRGVSAVTALFGIANCYLMRFRSVPLTFMDFADVGTAMNVASSYDYTPDLNILTLAAFFVMALMLVLKLNKEPFKKFWLTFGLYFAVYAVVALVTIRVMIFSPYLQNHNVTFHNFNEVKSYYRQGAALTFVRKIQASIAQEPEGYSEEEIEKLSEAYPSDSVSESGGTIRPNLIVVMNEAFSDLQAVGDFETNIDVMPNYHAMKENTVKGMLNVSVFGGHTANTEYEFLTGNSIAYCPSGTPYALYIRDKTPSLTRTLVQDGYIGNLAVHPFRPNGYNRNRVYPFLGFEDFISLEDFEGASLIKGHVSDDADYDYLISAYESYRKESSEPFYLFNVTMQNHSPYTGNYDNLPMDVKITSGNIKNKAAENYLNLIHLSDQANQKLVDYFSQVKEPTVIVMFGDHEPGLPDKFYNKILGKKINAMNQEESMIRYKTPYFIWANYDIEEGEEELSVNYLQSFLKEKTGMKMTGYDRYLSDLRSRVPILTLNGYYGADGVFYTLEDEDSPYYQDLKTYRCLNYNLLFADWEKKSRLFFLEP